VPSATAARLPDRLADPQPSVRLQAALAAGTHPRPGDIDALVDRCAVEPDFYVRDMLTWALTRHPESLTVPRLLAELHRPLPQARSQALHTLSKIGDRSAWPAITPELLRDPDDEVARSAWRAAVVLVPEHDRAELASRLVMQFGRGGREVQLSLSRALAGLGDAARGPVTQATTADDERVRTPALATLRLLDHPEESFEEALHQARRLMAMTGAPISPDSDSGSAAETPAGSDPDR
jgi:HEAT repeat protein